MRDADLYSRSYMLHMLFLHLANGSAVIIAALLWRKSYCLIVFLPQLFACFFFLESSESCRSVGLSVRPDATGLSLICAAVAVSMEMSLSKTLDLRTGGN